jgi:hypothetical protein
MNTPLDVLSALERVEELNHLCADLRNAYRRSHPSAPETREEQDMRILLQRVQRQHDIQLVAAYAD